MIITTNAVTESMRDTIATTVRTRILAYLGQLHSNDTVSARKLCYDLDLRFSTAKSVLTALEERGWVSKVISNDKCVVALYAIHPDAVVKTTTTDGRDTMVAMIPPEWEPAYGRHPYST